MERTPGTQVTYVGKAVRLTDRQLPEMWTNNDFEVSGSLSSISTFVLKALEIVGMSNSWWNGLWIMEIRGY